MPRQNPTRTVPFEAHVSANLSRERERAGLTYERLAERMTERGCPIQPSALHKIEKADPPRRITVNELMVIADVLGVKAFNLVDDPDHSIPREMWSIIFEVEDQQRTIDRARLEIDRAVGRMRDFIGDDARQRKKLRRYPWEDTWPEVREYFAPLLRERVGSKGQGR